MINKAILIGNVGADPEERRSASGSQITSFTVATTEQWTDKNGQRREQTEWHKVVSFGRLAEICSQYLAKGSKVYIEGRLQTRVWEDTTGIKKYFTEIIAQKMNLLDSNKEETSMTRTTESAKDSDGFDWESGQKSTVDFDDIPF